MSGQIPIRVTQQTSSVLGLITFLFRKKEMRELISGSPWKIDFVIPDEGPGYTAVLTNGGSSTFHGKITNMAL